MGNRKHKVTQFFGLVPPDILPNLKPTVLEHSQQAACIPSQDTRSSAYSRRGSYITIESWEVEPIMGRKSNIVTTQKHLKVIPAVTLHQDEKARTLMLLL